MSENEQSPEPVFTKQEARVFASLMEKHLTTPNGYPLTINALTNACNQKSSREPVMALSEGEVGHLANVLSERGFIKIEYGGRANKIHHLANSALGLDRRQQSILTVLMLRAPQTVNDIVRRTERMADFSDVDDVMLTLMELIENQPPLAMHLPRGAGQREDRYAHTLCGEIENTGRNESTEPVTSSNIHPSERDRLNDLEARIEELENQISRLLRTGNE